MLKLHANKTEPFWLEVLPGQRTLFRPVTMAMILAARAEANRTILAAAAPAKDGDAKESMQPPSFGTLPPRLVPSIAQAMGEQAFTRTIAQLGIAGWEGVADHTGAEITEPTPEYIDAYLDNWKVFDAIDKLYVNPALVSADEKNASAPSRSGTSGAKIRAKRIAGTARKNAGSARTS